jgi:outer membrane protein OmpA-like peptidoglycan-associated protein
MKLFFSAVVFIAITGYCAAQTDSISPGKASVQVTVTNFNKVPQPGEKIIFNAKKSGQQYTGIADEGGKFALLLPVGDTFIIKVKTIVDSTKYGIISIPALAEGMYYNEPFLVNVKFEAARSYKLDNVYFDFGKASLRPESNKELNELHDYLSRKTKINIEIAGHTDNVGNDADNLKLSQQRADAIRQFLIKKGIAPARVIAKGYGETQPVSDNTTDKGRQLNRRTEVKILD